MIKVIGVRFRTAGKIYFFDPLQFEIKRGDHVIVETARGIEYGTVVSAPSEVEEEKVVQPLKPVIRIANQRDNEQEAANKLKEKEAFRVCMEKIRQHELDMKLIDAEYTFDNNKVLFYFTADGRIDFRELVKDLASVFKTRIELRQIGVRDETKFVGGIGICGRPLCCHSYLSDFIPVSIKMAKEQNLSLNPAKISGVCGRLMCCLKNEEETYEELNRRLPSIGDTVSTEEGLRGEVLSVNVLRQQVKVIVEVGDEKEVREFQAKELHFKRKHTRKERMELSKEELEELERLEKEEFAEIKEHSAEIVKTDKAGDEKSDRNKPHDRQSSYSNRRSRNDRPENGERRDRQDRQNHYSNRNGRPEKAENGERTDRRSDRRTDRPERRENTERQNRPERQDNNGNRNERAEGQNNNSNRNERAEAQNNNSNRDERPEGQNNNGGRNDKSERQGRNRNRNRRPNRQKSQEGNPKSNDSEAKG